MGGNPAMRKGTEYIANENGLRESLLSSSVGL